MDFTKYLSTPTVGSSSAQKEYCSQLLRNIEQDSDEDVADETLDTTHSIGTHLASQLETDSIRRNLFSNTVSVTPRGLVDASPTLVPGSPSPPTPHAPYQPRNAKRKKWGPVQAARQSKRNIGKGDIMERARQYKMKQNLEIPKAFKGNSFAVLDTCTLSDTSNMVDVTIGNNVDEEKNDHC
jgi:hypothetical protein